MFKLNSDGCIAPVIYILEVVILGNLMKSLTQLIPDVNYNKNVAFILSLSLIFNPLALQAQSVNSSEDVDNKKVIAAKTADLEFYSLSNEELVKKIEEYYITPTH